MFYEFPAGLLEDGLAFFVVVLLLPAEIGCVEEPRIAWFSVM